MDEPSRCRKFQNSNSRASSGTDSYCARGKHCFPRYSCCEHHILPVCKRCCTSQIPLRNSVTAVARAKYLSVIVCARKHRWSRVIPLLDAFLAAKQSFHVLPAHGRASWSQSRQRSRSWSMSRLQSRSRSWSMCHGQKCLF
jgi:hypothetical protein